MLVRIAPLLKNETDYKMSEEGVGPRLTEEGFERMQELRGLLPTGTIATKRIPALLHHLQKRFTAKEAYHLDKEYVVKDGEVIIVDEFTGRVMPGRRWSDGLHQAVEAKERVPIKNETQTLATITLQNFFKLYKALAGMTGTAQTEAEEFSKIYKLEVVTIPTNRPVRPRGQRRPRLPQRVEKMGRDHRRDQGGERQGPPGAGRHHQRRKERNALQDAEAQVRHRARSAQRQAARARGHIVAKAGQQHENHHGKMVGNVTIATNMAGRGTDIKLAQQEALGAGGLHVIGTERHTARRIDNQLRGRGGRQGDPGLVALLRLAGRRADEDVRRRPHQERHGMGGDGRRHRHRKLDGLKVDRRRPGQG